ncbi:hypothetical protein LJC34_00480 [Oscillospiraceae bacterium OttesenSCG-928-G22]|nr:hypothetical protein [Oscillospiraceae bacterium OttesenSCG-928-G22]
MRNHIVIPEGIFRANDPAAEQRRLIAERLRSGQDVVISPSGELEEKNIDDEEVKLKAPKGELA